MSLNEKVSVRDRILTLFAGFNGTWVLVVGRRSGLLAAVGNAQGPVLEEALAKSTGFHLPYVRVWCRAGYAFGFLDWEDGAGYTLAPHMRELLLNPADPLYCGGRAEFYAATTEDFEAFPARLADGLPFPRAEHDPWLLRALSEMTRPDFTNLTGTVIPKCPGLGERLSRPDATMLDVGCGAGYGLVHFARIFPSLVVTGIEPDKASRALAERRLVDEGLSGRARIESTDALQLSSRETYDLAVLNVTLHETGGPDAWPDVLSRVREALKPGGTILLSELPYPGDIQDYRNLPSQLLAGVQHHEALVGCSAITVPELHQLLVSAGFDRVSRIDQPNPARVVYAGVRPG